MATDKELCDYIFALAEARHMNQVELAEACGVTRAAVNNWKKKGIVPSDNHAAIAKALRTTVDGLLTLGKTAPVLSLTEEQLSDMPSDTQNLVRQAVQFIEAAVASSSGRFDMRQATKALEKT